jgi:hypothetical protein
MDLRPPPSELLTNSLVSTFIPKRSIWKKRAMPTQGSDDVNEFYFEHSESGETSWDRPTDYESDTEVNLQEDKALLKFNPETESFKDVYAKYDPSSDVAIKDRDTGAWDKVEERLEQFRLCKKLMGTDQEWEVLVSKSHPKWARDNAQLARDLIEYIKHPNAPYNVRLLAAQIFIALSHVHPQIFLLLDVVDITWWVKRNVVETLKIVSDRERRSMAIAAFCALTSGTFIAKFEYIYMGPEDPYEGACEKFTLDPKKEFGTCTCGYKKVDHGKPRTLKKTPLSPGICCDEEFVAGLFEALEVCNERAVLLASHTLIGLNWFVSGGSQAHVEGIKGLNLDFRGLLAVDAKMFQTISALKTERSKEANQSPYKIKGGMENPFLIAVKAKREYSASLCSSAFQLLNRNQYPHGDELLLGQVLRVLRTLLENGHTFAQNDMGIMLDIAARELRNRPVNDFQRFGYMCVCYDIVTNPDWDKSRADVMEEVLTQIILSREQQTPGEYRAFAAEILDVVSPGPPRPKTPEDPNRKWTMEELAQPGKPVPEGVDATRKEDFLTLPEFQQAFGMSPKEYSALPEWKKKQIKTALKLF